ncbi:hypothetical protein Rsub_05064 [Raphidocelis subcapitata]|uniref:Uncharacterized protein n=1 Tax=Raphidocelis subcapitata TaxID=307507 RepID=A0A2V0P6H7_9CHLO|nr:hypothetical protein Rsub_05064 [Raphidocelis subcapitata]|eukprot:GBF92695.1 hypothetical protein Rsub_05064 [Raphidocelis subcapitata]
MRLMARRGVPPRASCAALLLAALLLAAAAACAHAGMRVQTSEDDLQENPDPVAGAAAFTARGTETGRGLLWTIKAGATLPKPVSPPPSPKPAAPPSPSPSPRPGALLSRTVASLLAKPPLPKPVASPSPKPAASSSSPPPSPAAAARGLPLSGLLAKVTGKQAAARPSPSPPAKPAASAAANASVQVPAGCTLAQLLLGHCKAAASPSASPSPSSPPMPASPYLAQSLHNGTCRATLLPNGDFQQDKAIDATALVGWAKLKENATVGGGGLFNGSYYSYSGMPPPPFNGSGRYFRSRPAGNVAFALVNNAPIHVTSTRQLLYFDWFVDNPWPYWFVAQSMSLLANGSETITHQARVDLYDFDKLVPPGNFSHLAALLFDGLDSQAGGAGNASSTAKAAANGTANGTAAGGGAYLGPVLLPDVVAATPNLASMATVAQLGDHVGKRVLVAFRYSTNVYYLGFGIDNVMVVECANDWWLGNS